jgi:hypothetical protein
VLRSIGVEGLVDFTTEKLSAKDLELIRAIVARCRRDRGFQAVTRE